MQSGQGHFAVWLRGVVWETFGRTPVPRSIEKDLCYGFASCSCFLFFLLLIIFTDVIMDLLPQKKSHFGRMELSRVL